MDTQRQLANMQKAWDTRARDNARHYIATLQENWTDEEFFATGDWTVNGHIVADQQNISGGKPLSELRALEIGCGAGRITRAMAKVFAEVHGVDISGEMIAQAREALRDTPNAHVYQNNGNDLSVVPDQPYHFAFSIFVFQHIPSYEIIENYLREVHRLLVPGALFKFQVQGDPRVQVNPEETWVGVPITESKARELAAKTGFELRYHSGAGQEEFWLWFFKKVPT
jgi:2-polyprenyl-3-methyl-5-hydroxy-6-metoxy-1,4-benzoquinol methylase